MTSEPTLCPATDAHRGVLIWAWPTPTSALSSAAVGGGFQQAHWLVNIGVPSDYGRTDLAEHAGEIATEHTLNGHGIGLFTAADVTRFRSGFCNDVRADATVGISNPTWAADPAARASSWEPGTINIVLQLPVGLEPGAAVNAVMTVTEAKTQALLQAGVHGTGTASDAVVITWPSHAAVEKFGGPRSTWGSRIAQATYSSVMAGLPEQSS